MSDSGLKVTENTKKYQAIIFDEAKDGLYSREAMSHFNKTYMVIRGNNNFTFSVLPNFLNEDKKTIEKKKVANNE